MATGRKAVPAVEANPATDGYLPLATLRHVVEALEEIETAAQSAFGLDAGALVLDLEGLPVDVIYSRGEWHVKFGVAK